VDQLDHAHALQLFRILVVGGRDQLFDQGELRERSAVPAL
jgi:hypothetical protein